MAQLNLTLPKSWAELSPSDFRFAFRCLTSSASSHEALARCALRFARCVVTEAGQDGAAVRHKGRVCYLTTEQLFVLHNAVKFLLDAPAFPARAGRFGPYKALEASFQGVPFRVFLYCDNLYEQFLELGKPEILSELAGVLYNLEDERAAQDWLALSCLYWFTSLKKHLAANFPHFLSSEGVPGASELLGKQPLAVKLRERMDAQIRALTKGDVTKEEAVLEVDTWRAFGELDALAKEAAELEKQKTK